METKDQIRQRIRAVEEGHRYYFFERSIRGKEFEAVIIFGWLFNVTDAVFLLRMMDKITKGKTYGLLGLPDGRDSSFRWEVPNLTWATNRLIEELTARWWDWEIPGNYALLSKHSLARKTTLAIRRLVTNAHDNTLVDNGCLQFLQDNVAIRVEPSAFRSTYYYTPKNGLKRFTISNLFHDFGHEWIIGAHDRVFFRFIHAFHDHIPTQFFELIIKHYPKRTLQTANVAHYRFTKYGDNGLKIKFFKLLFSQLQNWNVYDALLRQKTIIYSEFNRILIGKFDIQPKLLFHCWKRGFTLDIKTAIKTRNLKYFNAQTIATLLLAHHPRIGNHSPANILPIDIFRRVLTFI